jgi:exodeoxyribonuclease VII large subunit
VAKKPIRVSQLNAYIARILSSDSVLSDVMVAGEITGLKRHSSGHVFFGLKDAGAHVSCFLPAGVFRTLEIDLREGGAVVCEGYVNVYEKGGSYSLNIRRVFQEGQGALAAEFERLKKRLAEKGYFEAARKKPLPAFPLRAAIVTSKTGAAVEDMVKIMTARNSVCDILIFPSLVQGEGAAAMIADRLAQIGRDYADTDVIIVGRGGGSAEDLMAFNDEAVADAIFASKIPVISAVGHETDVTIADFVADRRAETPTAAAQMAVPDTGELSQDVLSLRYALKDGMARKLAFADMRVRANNMDGLHARLSGRAGRQGARADAYRTQMQTAVRARLQGLSGWADLCGERLLNLNPLGILSRGYAIIEGPDGRAIPSAGRLSAGDTAAAVFSDGRARIQVREVTMNE